ncbi:MAG TPA: VOC family protein [Acidimicrobiales bacterium]|nr:VOC family protein [Acidimicrobiales bacterium]
MPIDTSRPTIYPVLRYRDTRAAIGFLTAAFGFEPGEVNTDDRGRVVHALVTWGNGVLMLSDSRGGGDPFDLGPGVLYLVVDDTDGHAARAEAAGAEIVMPVTDQPYGSREYAARDPEGHVWCFGTYQPAPLAAAA